MTEGGEKIEIVISGPELFDRVCQLGGRYYYQKVESPRETRQLKGELMFFTPFAIALPVNPEETQHIIIFKDGQSVLVKVYNPPHETESQEYARQFSTKHTGSISFIDQIIQTCPSGPTKWVSTLKQSSGLKIFGNYTLVDPLDDDASMEVFLEALKKAIETSKTINEQKKKREIRLREAMAQILDQNSLQ